jgi:hypothetical protein
LVQKDQIEVSRAELLAGLYKVRGDSKFDAVAAQQTFE